MPAVGLNVALLKYNNKFVCKSQTKLQKYLQKAIKKIDQ